MKIPWLVGLIILINISLSCQVYLEAAPLELTKQVQVLGQAKTIKVSFSEPSRAAAAQVQLDRAAVYIPIVAQALGVAPALETYTIVDITDGTTTNARNDGTAAYLPFIYQGEQIPLGPALLYHEINHWWFPYGPRWISEGVVSYLPLVLAAQGVLNLDQASKDQILDWWGFYKPNPNPDLVLTDDERNDLQGDLAFSINYEKTLKIQYIIHQELGLQGYLGFLRLLVGGASSNANPPWVPYNQGVYGQGTQGILNLLETLKPRQWSNFLAGWVGKPVYGSLKPSAFSDTDDDGLMDIEEGYTGSNPFLGDTDGDGLGDFAESRLGTAIAQANSSMDFGSRFFLEAPVIDGVADEWQFFNHLTFTSPGQAGVQGRFDMVSFKAVIRGTMLYGALSTKEPMNPDPSLHQGVYVFLIDDSKPKIRDGFGFWFLPWSMRGWEYARVSGTPQGIRGRIIKAFEFAFDISEIRGKTLSIVPIIRPDAGGNNISYWNNWSPIQIPIPATSP